MRLKWPCAWQRCQTLGRGCGSLREGSPGRLQKSSCKKRQRRGNGATTAARAPLAPAKELEGEGARLASPTRLALPRPDHWRPCAQCLRAPGAPRRADRQGLRAPAPCAARQEPAQRHQSWDAALQGEKPGTSRRASAQHERMTSKRQKVCEPQRAADTAKGQSDSWSLPVALLNSRHRSSD